MGKKNKNKAAVVLVFVWLKRKEQACKSKTTASKRNLLEI